MDHSVNISLMFLERCRSLKFHSATICMANIRLDKLDMLNVYQSVFDMKIVKLAENLLTWVS